MRRVICTLFVFMISILFAFSVATAQDVPISPQATDIAIESSEKLVVMWTSGDKDVAEKMVFMYVYNAKKRGWWKDVTLIVWGPSSKLLSEDEGLQDYVKNMQAEGVILKACKACADMYGVSDKLAKLNIDVKYMGVEFTDYIKEGRHVITF